MIDKVKLLLRKNRVEEAIKIIWTYQELVENREANLILIESAYSRNIQCQSKGEISAEDFNIEENKVIRSIIAFLQLDTSDWFFTTNVLVEVQQSTYVDLYSMQTRNEIMDGIAKVLGISIDGTNFKTRSRYSFELELSHKDALFIAVLREHGFNEGEVLNWLKIKSLKLPSIERLIVDKFMREVVDGLDPHIRELYILDEYAGLNEKEIAKLTRKSITTVSEGLRISQKILSSQLAGLSISESDVCSFFLSYYLKNISSFTP